MKVKKRDDDYIIPLSTRALEIIQEIKTIRRGDYLFPGLMKRPSGRNILKDVRPTDPNAEGRPMCLSALDHFLRKNFGRTDIDPHGFRRTFSNWAHASGRFRDIAIELSLDHAYGTQISRVYRDEQLVEERRELLQAWSDYCDGTTADVIRLPVRSRRRKVIG
jgi:integrase